MVFTQALHRQRPSSAPAQRMAQILVAFTPSLAIPEGSSGNARTDPSRRPSGISGTETQTLPWTKMRRWTRSWWRLPYQTPKPLQHLPMLPQRRSAMPDLRPRRIKLGRTVDTGPSTPRVSIRAPGWVYGRWQGGGSTLCCATSSTSASANQRGRTLSRRNSGGTASSCASSARKWSSTLLARLLIPGVMRLPVPSQLGPNADLALLSSDTPASVIPAYTWSCSTYFMQL